MVIASTGSVETALINAFRDSQKSVLRFAEAAADPAGISEEALIAGLIETAESQTTARGAMQVIASRVEATGTLLDVLG